MTGPPGHSTRGRSTRTQKLLNGVIGFLLRSPLHRVVSGQLALVTYTGRQSGKRRTHPVMYAEHEGGLTVHVARAGEKVWWRNLRGGAPIRVRLRGRELHGRAEVVTGDESLAAAYVARFPRMRETVAGELAPVFVRVTDLEPR
jgi:deazaflavin-dependent oxidoreductase (nitroreductase family)